MNGAISDFAIDRGNFQLDLEFEGTTAESELLELQKRNLPATGANMPWRDTISQVVFVNGEDANR